MDAANRALLRLQRAVTHLNTISGASVGMRCHLDANILSFLSFRFVLPPDLYLSLLVIEKRRQPRRPSDIPVGGTPRDGLRGDRGDDKPLSTP